MRANKLLSLLIPVGFLGACTPVVPPELANARRAYSQASGGAASQAAPAELHKAKEALDVAEASFDDKPKAQKTLDLAYIAERKAEEAEAIGKTEMARRTRGDSERGYVQAQSALIGQTQGQLAQTREQLAATSRDKAAANAQLGTEREARAKAEAAAKEAQDRAKEAQDALAKLAMVKQEERGMVITLSGSVLFPSNQATLLPSAQQRLDQVAAALMATKERGITIEGYTDSRGSEEHNLDLSRRRAEAVRGYIVSKGYNGDLVVATGLGKSKPIADNSTAEGRANNRRVEIVVKNKGD